MEVKVNGAPTLAEARLVARTVVSSPLVKSAVHGNDPNWGRVMAVLGRSGVEVEEAKVDLYLDDICVARGGCAVPFDIVLNLNLGEATATAWGCDLSEEYVTINSQYTT